MKDYGSYEMFIGNFDIVQNAMEMRYLQRWNGRRIGKENLSEHTHLVTACAISIMDNEFKEQLKDKEIDKYKVIKACMLHDSVELLRGDILSITKRQLPVINEVISNEETQFFKDQEIELNEIEKSIVSLADIKAVKVFIKNEMQEGNVSDIIRQVYYQNEEVLDKKYEEIFNLLGIVIKQETSLPELSKGYEDDAGVDVILANNETFLPMSTRTVDLGITFTPSKNETGYICSRTSAAAKGLIVAMCPIDPNYRGHILAIVHNISNDIITYNKGESFCQIVSQPFIPLHADYVKKNGKRTYSNRGETDK